MGRAQVEHPLPWCRWLGIHIQGPRRSPVPSLARTKLVSPTTSNPNPWHFVESGRSEREVKEALAFGGRKKQELGQS